jgi:hypothetical protein
MDIKGSGQNMTRAKETIGLLLLVFVFGCAGQFQPQDASEAVAEQERQKQKKETAPPTFTYRPGS